MTGGSRGIGRSIVHRFAALGDHVVAVGRDGASLEEVGALYPERVRVAVCDVTDEAAVIALMKELGSVNVLVNSAGISDSAPLHRTTLESWNVQMATNATAVFLFTREVIADMRERGEGRIVTVASTAGRVGAAYAGAYSASKHAAIGVTRAAAAELAGTAATANAVCPAFVDSDMTRVSAGRIAERTGRTRDESIEALAKLAPLGRLLDPGEVADAVVWLASPMAGAINGQTIVLDGGGIQA
ncbi:MAG TPA: SDR family oxidoreductase [Solirubrobacteraceae bacterium]